MVGKLNPSELAAIHAAFADAHYMELTGDFECRNVHDLPGVHTSYYDGTREKFIEHDCNRHPDARMLSHLEAKLEQILGSERWVGSAQERHALEQLPPRESLRQELEQIERFHLVPAHSSGISVWPTWIDQGVPTVQGSMAVELVERIVQRQIRALESCQYEMGKCREYFNDCSKRKCVLSVRMVDCRDSNRPKYTPETGDMTVQFHISPRGDLGDAAVKSSTLKDPAVAACILAEVRKWVALPPPGSDTVEIWLPLHFKGARAAGALPAVPSTQNQ